MTHAWFRTVKVDIALNIEWILNINDLVAVYREYTFVLCMIFIMIMV